MAVAEVAVAEAGKAVKAESSAVVQPTVAVAAPSRAFVDAVISKATVVVVVAATFKAAVDVVTFREDAATSAVTSAVVAAEVTSREIVAEVAMAVIEAAGAGMVAPRSMFSGKSAANPVFLVTDANTFL